MKKFLISFLAGLMCIGIGSGICFAEFTSFEFGGNKYFSSELKNEKTMTYDFTLKGTGNIIIRKMNDINPTVLVDNNMQEDEIRFEVTYDPITTEVYVEENGKVSVEYYIGANRGQSFRFDVFKQMLEDSKNKIVYNYKESPSEVSFEIYVNENNLEKIKFKSW